MFCIAIDGPAGSGKSTISKMLAKELNFTNIDTGALYRAIAYYFSRENIDPNTINIENELEHIKIDVHNENFEQQIFLNDVNITDKIRTEKISKLASECSKNILVREYLLGLQRDLARKSNTVIDGRDIGTVVVPNADVKIFLTASPETRAKRRYLELKLKDPNVNYEDILKDIKNRDTQDMNRELSPLKITPDYIKVDNTEYNLEETVKIMLDVIKRSIKI